MLPALLQLKPASITYSSVSLFYLFIIDDL